MRPCVASAPSTNKNRMCVGCVMRTKTSRNHGTYANHGAPSAPYTLVNGHCMSQGLLPVPLRLIMSTQ